MRDCFGADRGAARFCFGFRFGFGFALALAFVALRAGFALAALRRSVPRASTGGRPPVGLRRGRRVLSSFGHGRTQLRR